MAEIVPGFAGGGLRPPPTARPPTRPPAGGNKIIVPGSPEDYAAQFRSKPKPPKLDSTETLLRNLLSKQPALRGYGGAIRAYATTYRLDPYYLALLLIGDRELPSQARPGQSVPWAPGKTFTYRDGGEHDLANPSVRIHATAVYFSVALDANKEYASAYRESYRVGSQANPFVSAPANYVPRGIGRSLRELTEMFAAEEPKQPKLAATETLLRKLLAGQPGLRSLGGAIRAYATTYRLDPYYLALLLVSDPNMPAQVYPGQRVPWEPDNAFTYRDGGPNDLGNPSVRVHAIAAYFSSALDATKDYATAYSEAYRLGSKTQPFRAAPANYTPHGIGRPLGAVPTVEEKAVYVMRDGAGRIIKRAYTAPPRDRQPDGLKPVLVYGHPLLAETLAQFRHDPDLGDTNFHAYVGRSATDEEIVRIRTTGMLQPQIISELIRDGWLAGPKKGTPEGRTLFRNSPIWKQKAVGVRGNARALIGPDAVVSDEFIARSIAENWTEATFVAKVRELPAYEQGPVFKQAYAGALNVYQTIYGNPQGEGETIAQSAARAGWSPDQLAGWLRSQPNYTYSPEYQAKVLSVLDALGVVTGTRPTLRAGIPVGSGQPGGFGELPGAPPPGTYTGLAPRLKGATAPPPSGVDRNRRPIAGGVTVNG